MRKASRQSLQKRPQCPTKDFSAAYEEVTDLDFERDF